MKRVVSVLLAVCLLVCFGGCAFVSDIADMAGNEVAKSKTFDLEGVTIVLTTDFLRMDFISEEYDFIVGNDQLTVLGTRLPHEETAAGDMTVAEFAAYFRDLMADSAPTPLTLLDGIPTMQIRVVDEEDDQTMAMMFYEGTDCFWMLCFSAATADFQALYGDICRYAKSVTCA